MSEAARLRVADPRAVHARTARSVAAAVAAVLQEGRWVGGATLARVEAALAGALGCAHGVGVGSGTAALQLALQAVGVRPGDEVIVPAVSFVATGTAVLRVGARPVVVDVTPGLPLLDPEAVRRALGPRVRAVVPVALFGCAAPALSLPSTVAVVDDAAQAMGRTAPVGAGACHAVSFYPTKVLAAAGDGGLVATDDPGLAARVRALGFHGRRADGRFDRVEGVVAGNERLDVLQAAILEARLADLQARVAHRRALLARYRLHLPHLVLPHDAGSNVAVVAAVHPRRAALRSALAAAGIDTACYYPRPLSEEPVLRGARVPAPLLRAHAFTERCLALPCHIGLQLTDVDRICARIQELPA